MLNTLGGIKKENMFEAYQKIEAAYGDCPHEYARLILLNPSYLQGMSSEWRINTLAYLRMYLLIDDSQEQKLAYCHYIMAGEIEESEYNYFKQFIHGFMECYTVLRKSNATVDKIVIGKFIDMIENCAYDKPIRDMFGDSIINIHCMRNVVLNENVALDRSSEEFALKLKDYSYEIAV